MIVLMRRFTLITAVAVTVSIFGMLGQLPFYPWANLTMFSWAALVVAAAYSRRLEAFGRWIASREWRRRQSRYNLRWFHRASRYSMR